MPEQHPVDNRNSFRVAPSPIATVRGLRHQILRPHQTPDDCVYPGDDDSLTGHFGVFDGESLCGIASVYCDAPDCGDFHAEGAWRLRGMATIEVVRGSGAGRLLIDACIDHALANDGTYLWCNARTTAAGFYDRCGFERDGDAFELPGIGPHYFMYRQLG